MNKESDKSKEEVRKRENTKSPIARRIEQEKHAHTDKPITKDTDPFFTEEDAERRRRNRTTVIVDN